MQKEPKRKKINVPRKCIFCEKGGNPRNPMSAEHLWPEWMHPFLPKIPKAQKEKVYEIRRMNKQIYKTKKSRQGHAYTTKFKVVCKKCNETWMSKIEEDAKPILVPLLQGSLITLLKTHRLKLTRWIALKAMVAEQENPQDAVIQQKERTAFKETRKIPDSLQIWIATHVEEAWHSGFWKRTVTLTTSAEPPITGKLKNIQSTAFGFGRAFSYSLVNTVPNFHIEISESFSGVKRLWPLTTDNIRWPFLLMPLPILNRIAEHLGELMNSPIAEWRPLPSRKRSKSD